MPGVQASQLRRALIGIGELAEVDQLEHFPARVSALLRELIPCHHSGYTAIELATRRVYVVGDPPDSGVADQRSSRSSPTRTRC